MYLSLSLVWKLVILYLLIYMLWWMLLSVTLWLAYFHHYLINCKSESSNMRCCASICEVLCDWCHALGEIKYKSWVANNNREHFFKYFLVHVMPPTPMWDVCCSLPGFAAKYIKFPKALLAVRDHSGVAELFLAARMGGDVNTCVSLPHRIDGFDTWGG